MAISYICHIQFSKLVLGWFLSEEYTCDTQKHAQKPINGRRILWTRVTNIII